ncbi:hypothetical protein AgCh_017808 [Apium graveolens]
MIASLSSFKCISFEPFGKNRVRKYPIQIIVSQRFQDEGNSHNNFVDANLRILSKRIEALRRNEKNYNNGWSYIKLGYDQQNYKHRKVERWQRINEGAQKFGACYDEAQRKIGSSSNLDNIIEKAHQDHLINYKKKSNFELHWCELRRHPKWRTPPTSASSKRTKISSSGAYSSEGNNDTSTSEEFEPVRPPGTKAATKRKEKGKARAVEVDEWESLQIKYERKMDIMDKLNDI